MAKQKGQKTEEIEVITPEIVELAKTHGVDEGKIDIAQTTKGLQMHLADRVPLEQQFEEIKAMDIESAETWKKARELRIKIRDNRTKGIMTWHKSAKEFFLRGGQFIDAVKNMQVAVNEQMEEVLGMVEKHEERRKQEARDKLKKEREELAVGLEDYMPKIDFSVLEASDFEMMLDMARAKKKKDEEDAAAKEEEERERKRKEAVVYKRRVELAKYASVVPAEELEDAINSYTEEQVERFVESADKIIAQKELEMQQAKKAAEEERKKREAAELEAKKAREEAQKKIDEENARRDAELAEVKRKAEEERQKAIAEAAKKDAEIAEAKKAAEAAEKAREEAEKGKLTPDAMNINTGIVTRFEEAISSAVATRDGIEGWVDLFQAPSLPTELAADNRAIEILNKFEGFKTWANKLAKK